MKNLLYFLAFRLFYLFFIYDIIDYEILIIFNWGFFTGAIYFFLWTHFCKTVASILIDLRFFLILRKYVFENAVAFRSILALWTLDNLLFIKRSACKISNVFKSYAWFVLWKIYFWWNARFFKQWLIAGNHFKINIFYYINFIL